MKRIIALAVLFLTFGPSAWALESGNLNLTLEDGSAGLTCKQGPSSTAGILIDADGQGGNAFACVNSIPSTIAMDAGSMTAGVFAPARIVTTCAAGNYLKMNSGGSALECSAGSGSGSSMAQLFSASSETRLGSAGASATRTAYMGLAGKLSQGALNLDTVFLPLPSGGTFNNLRCKLNDTLTGTSASIKVSLVGGVCSAYATWQLETSALSVTMNSGDSGSQTTNSARTFAAPTGSPTAAQCVGFRVDSVNTTNSLVVNCAIEKTA
ncbi:hypothetical protein UFOVP1287_60 [uncultured Caudovirales phage]|uniref:Uncharacterized protein n=1 Tax=uncultured Caudovirales phage TaxID=2100421 RepID=A0A6J5RG25_9CAUD|nr:hypothetical protein UFOVP1287_60 [uncultured Caudovirales phage]CAB4205269.1 hypothetical protein UFOVP1408_53 [uncultured Caudovirales phage]